MSYLEELKKIIQPKLEEKSVRVMLGGGSLRLLMGTEIVMNVSDKGEYVELATQGKIYRYDKWYTKPKHLAVVILRQFGFDVPPETSR